MLQFRDDLAGLARGFDSEVGAAGALTPVLSLGAQRLQCPHPPLVAGAPGLDTLANPHLFLCQLFVEQFIGPLFGFQLLLAVAQETLVITAPLGQVTPVELSDTVGHILQEAPVVGDQDNGAGETGELLFQPAYRGDIQVVGRLIQQQQVRLAHQRLCQRHAATPAAGELTHSSFGRQLQLADSGFNTLLQLPAIGRFQLRLHARQHRHIRLLGLYQSVVFAQQAPGIGQSRSDHIVYREFIRLREGLLQAGDTRAGAHPALAGICAQLSRQYL